MVELELQQKNVCRKLEGIIIIIFIIARTLARTYTSAKGSGERAALSCFELTTGKKKQIHK